MSAAGLTIRSSGPLRRSLSCGGQQRPHNSSVRLISVAPRIPKSPTVATRIVLCLVAAISFGLSAKIFFYEWYFASAIPPRASLKSVTGAVEWNQGKRFEIRFRLKGVPELLVYSRPNGNIGLVG